MSAGTLGVNQGTQSAIPVDTFGGINYPITKIDVGNIGSSVPWQGSVTVSGGTINAGTLSLNPLSGVVLAGTVGVGTVATALPASALANRKSLILYNTGTATVYIGGSGVGTATGIPVGTSSYSPSFDLGTTVLYGICATSGGTMNVLEAS